MRCAPTLLLWCACLASGPALPALPADIDVRAQNPEQVQRFSAALNAHLEENPPALNVGGAVIVALGERAFRQALAQRDGRPVLGVSVPRPVAERLMTAECQCSAIWPGVPLSRQLSLLRTLMPEARRVGVLLGAHSAWRQAPAPAHGVSLEVVRVVGNRQLGPLLRRHLPDWDALLLPEDDHLFNAGSAKLVLLTSYRQRVPVIGPNAAFVEAGSVASGYAALDDMARACADWLRHRDQHHRWPAPGFAGHYRPAVNEYVARAYDLIFESLGALRRALAEGAP